MRFSAVAGLLVLSLVPRGRPSPASVASSVNGQAPLVETRVFEGTSATRGSITCVGEEAHVELDGRLAPLGLPPIGDRAVVTTSAKDGVATCIGRQGRSAWRLRPLQIRAVTPTVAKDATHVVVSVDGQALGPLGAGDDGVYLVWRGAVVPLVSRPSAACPEARVADDHLVACAPAQLVRDRGPARIRVQSAGRLEEAAGAPIDLGALLAHPRS